MNELKAALNNVVNPKSGKKIFEENRLTKVEEKDGEVYISYLRNGLNLEEKKALETKILITASQFLEEDKINIMSFSSDENVSVDHGDRPEAPKAQLKTGHATIGAKKRVPGVKHVVAIGSGKGGVGKSTFSVNLAVTMANKGYKVGLIDADIYGPSVPLLLNKKGEKPTTNENKKIIPIESSGISFISFGLFVNDSEPVIWRGPMLGGVLNQFLFDVNWEGYDYLFIDLPPGTGDIQLSMVQNAEVDGSIIISTPQDVALLDARKGLEMFRKLNLPILGMVENMSSFICSNCNHEHFIFGQGGVEKAIEEIGVPFLGKVPLEIELRECSDLGTPYMSKPEYEGRSVWNSFFSIGSSVEAFFGHAPVEKKGFLSRLFK